jgi:CheY-like chemotaxis protein
MAHILIAEPSAAVRQLLEHVITGLGHQAVNPDELSGDLDCDVLLLEPAWPRGCRIARQLLGRKPALPIIFVGGTKQAKLAETLMAHAEIPKPFALEDLERAIIEAVAEAGKPANQ